MDNWTSRKKGDNCPLCIPSRADNDASRRKIITLNISTLYLDTNQTYPGYCILIFDKYHANGLDDLAADEYSLFMQDLYRSSKAVKAACKPEHINYASLGNLFPHLHIHLIPRYLDDPRWGAPIWTDAIQDMPIPSLSEGEYQQAVEIIRRQFD